MTTGIENLKPPINKRTTDEARRISQRGGKKSGESRNQKKLFKNIFETLFEKQYKDQDDNTITAKEIMALKIMKRAMDGDLRAFEIIRDTVGEKPVDRLANTDSEGNDLIPIISSRELLSLMEKRKSTLDEKK
ncbi:hypothetical protein FACS1894152_4380 [Bacilli bacterium]|nr:hypothetical protein FACS1894152_4380 [Bacilli bacterium]